MESFSLHSVDMLNSVIFIFQNFVQYGFRLLTFLVCLRFFCSLSECLSVRLMSPILVAILVFPFASLANFRSHINVSVQLDS